VNVGEALGLADGAEVGDEVGEAVGMKEMVGEALGWFVGCLVGKKVVAQTPLQEGQSQRHISALVQVLQQESQLHLLERKTFDPREVTEFGIVTALVKPEQPENAPFPMDVTEEGIMREPVKP
jgi:hypothetical protein